MPQDKQFNRRSVLKIAGATGTVGLAGCLGEDEVNGDDDTVDDGNGVETQPEDELSVTLGTTVPLSGPFSPTGERIVNSIELGLKHALEEGDIDDFTHLTMDSQTDVQVSQQNAQEMINDGADFLQGSVLDPAGRAIAGVGERENTLNISQGTNYWSAAGDECFENYFHLTQTIPAQIYTGMDYFVRNDPGETSVYQIATDYDWPQDLVEYSQDEYFPNTDATDAGVSFVPLGQSDYSEAVTTAANSGADLVRFVGWGTDLINMVESAAEFGYMDNEIPITSAAFTTAFADGMDKELISYDEAYWGMHWYHDMSPAAREYRDAYYEEYGDRPAMEGIHYPVTRTLMRIVGELEDTDTDEVREELSGRVWEPKLWGEDVDVKYRECNNQNTIPALTAKGLPVDEIDRDAREYLEVVDIETDIDNIGFPCEVSPCYQ